MYYKLTFVSLFIYLLSFAVDKPNIIVIMADDLGYECIGANGCEDYKTPHLDKLAKEGMRFTNCFSNPICTPSRVKIMTGMYNVRNYQKFGLLPRNQKTFAHVLKAAGYSTCIAGKWQLGNETDSPQHFGFDQSCLWQQSLPREVNGFDSRFTNPKLDINGVQKDFPGKFGPDVCTDFIIDFIKSKKDSPFFVYYPMILTHCPFVPTPGTPDYDAKDPGSKTYKGDHKYFKDMDQHMDLLIGRIVKSLDDLKIRDKTMIIFTGDNGTDRPVKTKMNGQIIAGGKGNMNDHGFRVPFIVNYPSKVKPAVSDELVEFTDILPTLCDVSGTPIPKDRPMEGVSLWPSLQGKDTRVKPWVYIWYHGKVVARNKTHMVRRMKNKLEYLDAAIPYNLKKVDLESADENDQAVYKSLVKVVEDFDKVRGSHLAEGISKDAWNKRK